MIPKILLICFTILVKADILGLSGLITPSLDEMISVAKVGSLKVNLMLILEAVRYSL